MEYNQNKSSVFITFWGETEPFVGETHPAGLCADKPLVHVLSVS